MDKRIYIAGSRSVAMPDRKPREKVVAEITVLYLTQVAAGIGQELSREDAVAFLNQEGRAYAMWKQMMRAGEEYIKSTLRHSQAIPLHRPTPPRGRVAI
jgi:hypothetical protein